MNHAHPAFPRNRAAARYIERLLIAAGLLVFLYSLPAAEAAPAEDTGLALVAAHQTQARALTVPAGAATPQSPVTQTCSDVAAAEAAFTAVRAEKQTTTQAWNNREGLAAILTGLPADLLTNLTATAGDNARTCEFLKQPLTLGPLLALAALRNQEVRAAYLNWQAALQRFDQADYLQDLVSRYAAFTREIDTEVGPQQHKEDPDLTFASPSVLALKGQLVDQDVEIARLAYLQKVRAVVMEFAKEYFETEYHLRTVEIRKGNRVLVQQMLESAGAQLKAGRVSQADVLKTQTLLEMVDNQIVQEIDHIVPHHVALMNAMLDLPPETPWGPITRIDLPQTAPTIDAVTAEALQHNQRVLQTAEELTQAATMLRMAETMVLPRASLGASRIHPTQGAEAGPTRNPDTTFPETPTLPVPMPDFGPNLAWLDELRIRVAQARALHEAAAQQLSADVRVKHHYLHLAVRTVKTLDTVVPQSKQAFEILQANYASGNTPLVEFLDAGRAYFDSALMQEEARMDLNERWVDLEDALGVSVTAVLPPVAPVPVPPSAPAPVPQAAPAPATAPVEAPAHD